MGRHWLDQMYYCLRNDKYNFFEICLMASEYIRVSHSKWINLLFHVWENSFSWLSVRKILTPTKLTFRYIVVSRNSIYFTFGISGISVKWVFIGYLTNVFSPSTGPLNNIFTTLERYKTLVIRLHLVCIFIPAQVQI